MEYLYLIFSFCMHIGVELLDHMIIDVSILRNYPVVFILHHHWQCTNALPPPHPLNPYCVLSRFVLNYDHPSACEVALGFSFSNG